MISYGKGWWIWSCRAGIPSARVQTIHQTSDQLMERAGGSENAGPPSLLQECRPYTRLLISWWKGHVDLIMQGQHPFCKSADYIPAFWSVDDIIWKGLVDLIMQGRHPFCKSADHIPDFWSADHDTRGTGLISWWYTWDMADQLMISRVKGQISWCTCEQCASVHFIYIEHCSVHVPVPVQVNMGPGRKARKVPVPYMWTA